MDVFIDMIKFDLSYGAFYNTIGGVTGVLFAIAFIFFIKRVIKFYLKFFKKENDKAVAIIAIIISVVLGITSIDFWRVPFVLCFYAFLIIIFIEVLHLIIKIVFAKSSKIKDIVTAIRDSGIIHIILFIAIVVYGFININNVVKTEYIVETDKNIRSEGYKIVYVSDVHYDTIQPKSALKKAAQEISDMNPDILILGGDIVEEYTSNESMREVFRILGNVNTKYGVYYNYGNHDIQPYTGLERSFSDEELALSIEGSGITILEDDYLIINDEILLLGRADVSWGSDEKTPRKDIAEIIEDADRNLFIINSDHQPVDAEESMREGVDLQLSGHTHAGQVYPMGVGIELIQNTPNYGKYEYGDTLLIVSSGEAGGNYPIRTEQHCEYLVIDLISK